LGEGVEGRRETRICHGGEENPASGAKILTLKRGKNVQSEETQLRNQRGC